MKYACLLLRSLLAALVLLGAGSADAQMAWRPFRPGLIYSFEAPSRSSVYLLKLDSAYVTAAGDSAWAFNRLLRPVNDKTPGDPTASPDHRKSRNNLFGGRLLWQPGTSDFVLENLAEGGSSTPLSLRLRPRVAVGTTWVAGGNPVLTATLSGRGWQPVSPAAGAPSDTVATITLSSGTVLRLSRRFGLLQGPRWLNVALGAGAEQWAMAALPASLAQSPLSPAAVFGHQAGHVLGYVDESFSYGQFVCYRKFTLRQIISRQVVLDSLLFTYREQDRTQTFGGAPGCGSTSGTVTGPVRLGRIAVSLRTGQSPQYPALPLLTGEYKVLSPGSAQVLAEGLGVLSGTTAGCAGSNRLTYRRMYLQSGGLVGSLPVYRPGLDAAGWYQAFSQGLGDVSTYTTSLQYYDRTSSGGAYCGVADFQNYAGLLPTRAAQAAAVATLAPNPAAEAATLTLARPAGPGTALRLTDALGRTIWHSSLAAGQTTVAVPLAGRPAGLYLLHLSGPAATATWKLVCE